MSIELELRKLFCKLTEKEKVLLLDLSDYNAYFQHDYKTNAFYVDAILEKAKRCSRSSYDFCVGARYNCYKKSQFRMEVENVRGVFDYFGFNFKKVYKDCKKYYDVHFYNDVDYKYVIEYLELAKKYSDQAYKNNNGVMSYIDAEKIVKFVIAPDVF